MGEQENVAVRLYIDNPRLACPRQAVPLSMITVILLSLTQTVHDRDNGVVAIRNN